ncbi:MAG: DinB family protein [Bacteroidota bacterium]
MDIHEIKAYTQEEIVQETRLAWKVVGDFTHSINEEQFHFQQIEGKWTAAENLEHLFMSTKPLVKALNMPKLVLGQFGKPNRPTRTLPEIASRYYERLSKTTMTAESNGYGPKVAKGSPIEEHLEKWNSIGEKYVQRIAGWKDDDLDKYLLPHPLLGKMMVREMLLFTILHTYHHLNIMTERVKMG